MKNPRPSRITLFFLTVTIFSNHSFAQTTEPKNLPQLGEKPIKEVIAAMTLEEKAKLVVGNGFKMPGTKPDGPALGQTQDRVAGAAGTTFAIPRLGIPSVVVADGPAGVRIDSIRNNDHSKTYYATAWPAGTLLASTWDTSLVRKVGAAFGNEVREYGIDILLGPGMNIHRNPLGGRNFEYYSEDPVVTGNIAAALVNGIQSNGVGTSIKHFAANNQETDRSTVNTILSERALREIYLKGFEIAVKESNPWTVMSSYNYINGVYASESYDLLTTILRKEWGYKGFVMSDWFGGKDPVAQQKAGNNLLMPGTTDQSEKIIDAVKKGNLSEKILDENIEQVLNIILKSPSFQKYKYSDQPDLVTHAQLSREAAVEGMVLLKNQDNALPFTQQHSIALFGINGYDLIAGGKGSGDVNKAYKISLKEGLTNAGYTTDAELETLYTNYLVAEKAKQPKKSIIEEFTNPNPPILELGIDIATVQKKATENDIALIAIGRNGGEGQDRKLESDYYLNDIEKTMIKKVSDAFHAQHKKVIVILNIGGVIDVSEWRDDVDAVLLVWQPGLEGGNAIADILSGKINPSGKLATTFPAQYKDVPSAKNFPGVEFPDKAYQGSMGRKLIPAQVTYEEGIYVGYRYYNSFHVKTAYEFGYGLSYTNFAYSNLTLSAPVFNGNITADITVTNTGKVAGKEIVQLYLSAPAKDMDKPTEELKAFAKTNLLKPGESQTISFTLSIADLASFNTAQSAWIADAGVYTIKIGASSLDINQAKTFQLEKDWVVEKTANVLFPAATINELKNK